MLTELKSPVMPPGAAVWIRLKSAPAKALAEVGAAVVKPVICSAPSRAAVAAAITGCVLPIPVASVLPAACVKLPPTDSVESAATLVVAPAAVA